jgi:hypothetical protein
MVNSQLYEQAKNDFKRRRIPNPCGYTHIGKMFAKGSIILTLFTKFIESTKA